MNCDTIALALHTFSFRVRRKHPRFGRRRILFLNLIKPRCLNFQFSYLTLESANILLFASFSGFLLVGTSEHILAVGDFKDVLYSGQLELWREVWTSKGRHT